MNCTIFTQVRSLLLKFERLVFERHSRRPNRAYVYKRCGVLLYRRSREARDERPGRMNHLSGSWRLISSPMAATKLHRSVPKRNGRCMLGHDGTVKVSRLENWKTENDQSKFESRILEFYGRILQEDPRILRSWNFTCR